MAAMAGVLEDELVLVVCSVVEDVVVKGSD
jgi:hypothetical protein